MSQARVCSRWLWAVAPTLCLPLSLLAFLAVLGATGSAPAAENILLVIADDVGVDKVGAYRAGECVAGQCPSPPATPAIDGLAARGILFRNAWATPFCSSSRVSLLSGRHPSRIGVGFFLSLDRSDEVGIAPTAPNIANSLKAAGYATAAFGKWHVAGCPMAEGRCTGGPVDYAGHPIRSGFDYFAGAPANFAQSDYCSWEKIVSERTGPGEADYRSRTFTSTTYATVDTIDDAIERIPELQEPWFVWLAFSASHVPVHRVPEVAENCEFSTEGDHVELYDGMTTKLDAELGRLLAALSGSPDLLARTTVIFLGDNGTLDSATVPPFVVAHAKGKIYEGGINVPLVIAGPRVADRAQGGEAAGLVGVTDVFASVMELAGLDPCANREDCAEDSVSLVPYLSKPGQVSIRESVYTERFVPNRLGYPKRSAQAVRVGNYKLIRKFGGNASDFKLRFFDLSKDPFETANLLKQPLGPEAKRAFVAASAEIRRMVGACVALDDRDADCVPDVRDNCPDRPNGPSEEGVVGRGNQGDVDADGIGDACDPDTGPRSRRVRRHPGERDGSDAPQPRD